MILVVDHQFKEHVIDLRHRLNEPGGKAAGLHRNAQTRWPGGAFQGQFPAQLRFEQAHILGMFGNARAGFGSGARRATVDQRRADTIL